MNTTTTSTPSSDRGARVIERAIELMRLGQAKGWSHALAMARGEVRQG